MQKIGNFFDIELKNRKNSIDDDFLDLEFDADPLVFILFWNLEFL